MHDPADALVRKLEDRRMTHSLGALYPPEMYSVFSGMQLHHFVPCSNSLSLGISRALRRLRRQLALRPDVRQSEWQLFEGQRLLMLLSLTCRVGAALV